MKQEAHEILKKCLANHRAIVLSGKSACIGVMKDYGGREHPETSLLAEALEEQIPDRLQQSQPITAEIITSLASQFAAKKFYTQDMANFAVQSWADAFGLWTLDSSLLIDENNKKLSKISVQTCTNTNPIPERGEDYALPVTCDPSWTKVNVKIDMNDGRGLLVYLFDIPKGSIDGQVILLSGQGKLGKNGGRPGDLRLLLNFPTKGEDYSCPAKVDFTLNSASAIIDMSDGRGLLKYKFDLPPDVRPNQVIRLIGKGKLSTNGGQPGDLLLTLNFLPNGFFDALDTLIILPFLPWILFIFALPTIAIYCGCDKGFCHGCYVLIVGIFTYLLPMGTFLAVQALINNLRLAPTPITFLKDLLVIAGLLFVSFKTISYFNSISGFFSYYFSWLSF